MILLCPTNGPCLRVKFHNDACKTIGTPIDFKIRTRTNVKGIGIGDKTTRSYIGKRRSQVCSYRNEQANQSFPIFSQACLTGKKPDWPIRDDASTRHREVTHASHTLISRI